MSKSRSLSLIVQTARGIASQHGKYGAQPQPPDQRLLSAEQAESLEKIALEKIRVAAKEDKLMNVRDLTWMLYCRSQRHFGQAGLGR